MAKMLVRDKAPLELKAGKRPSERSIEELLDAGMIIMDKPQGPTSHQATAWVREILHTEKIGHGGTLDPKVSGVLPVATGRAVRALNLVLRSDKEYVCLMRLHRDRKEEDIRKVIASFVGRIYQTPPVRSAVKRQMRIRTIHSINVLEVRGRDVLFRVRCDAGTYIRTLCVDIGDALGVGASMEDLRRTRSGDMIEDRAVTLQDIKDAYVMWKEDGDDSWLRSMVLPFEVLFDPLPKVVLKDSAVDAVAHGADLAVVGVVQVDGSVQKETVVAMFTAKGEAVAVGTAKMAAEEMTRAKDGVAVSTDRVYMLPGTYPKMW
ncbi:RNA-guided pseudouridylation complex pseudouridine synthase subunit Cbf5 [Methanomassiliicoccus luminyensis]|uniref:RNA-guided pseudouridylation complex pseudouridine synthase subunit Cbf5 n=1 Tax=Methanomassiliicoccus luminyensis TaxID=1080712 RepID=UPI000370E4DC|nr:RNA-guided pseudouridylation complex pseudouridine synthase subunit Cbf5 [Methanomassiliicoccus luminyensis]